MKKPVTNYPLREIVKNGTVHPQVIFTITAQEVADLSHELPRLRPSLVPASPDTPDAMTVIGLNKHVSGNAGFKAEKDLTLAYLIFAKRAMKHNHTVKVWAWNGTPNDDGKEAPHGRFFFAPREFRKNIRLPPSAAAQKFYQSILGQSDFAAGAPPGCGTLKIFSQPR